VRHLRHLPSREGEEVRSFLNRERKVLLVLAALGFVAARLQWPVCPFSFFLGVPCPGCGLSRATFALLRGDVQGALAAHPLVFVALPGTVALLLHATSRDPVSARRENIAALFSALLLALLVSVWLARFAGAFGGPAAI
jgi:hypothetical protein